MNTSLLSLANEILLYTITGVLLCLVAISVIFAVKSLINKKYTFILHLLITIIVSSVFYEIMLFNFYYQGLKTSHKKNYEQTIKIYNKVAKLTPNPKLKSFLYGEIGTLYLLIPQKGFDVIKAYNTAYIYSKTYKPIKNNEIWSFPINKLFYRKNSNSNSSNWPLIAAKAYAFENHFERAKKIYLTTNDSPIWPGLVIISILENNYNNALKYSDTIIVKEKASNSYAKRANIHKMLGNKQFAISDVEQAKLLCNKNVNCINSAQTLSERYAYDTYQNYFNQRKWMGFE